MLPLSLYIHMPWCVEKCPYCDFNSHQMPKNLPESDYVAQLLADLAQDVARFALSQRRLHSIFIGGGTPSLFSGAAITDLLNGVAKQLVIDNKTEITLEANPGTVDFVHFRDYRQAGVNRLSLGIQSFDDASLKRLGRIHDSKTAKKAIETAYQVGFENINLDLIFGLPNQSIAAAKADVVTALSFATSHLSYYQLTLEPNTAFFQNPPPLPEDDAIDAQFEAAAPLLAAAGFTRYEVSAWAKTGRQAKHNLNYWQFGDYLGIGAGAHGKITQQQQIFRTVKTRAPMRYLAANLTKEATTGANKKSAPIAIVDSQTAAFVTTRQVSDSEKPFEFMLGALRLMQGFSMQTFTTRTCLPSSTILPTLQSLAAKELLTIDGDWIAPTPLGQRFVNDMVTAFLIEE